MTCQLLLGGLCTYELGCDSDGRMVSTGKHDLTDDFDDHFRWEDFCAESIF